jgi:Htaa
VLAALVALAGTAALIAAPASAAGGQGSATIEIAKGKGLSVQGIKLTAIVPATKSEQTVTLPVWDVEVGNDAGAKVRGGLRLAANGRTVRLTGLRLALSGAVLTGKLGGKQLNLFRIDGTPAVDNAAGTASLGDSELTLTGAAAKALREKLRLEKALAKQGAGRTTLNAKADPVLAATQAVVSGQADWGVLASWRAYVLGQQGPPPPSVVGTVTAEGGATTNGTMSAAAGFFGFPASGGTYEKGLYGAPDRLTLTTAGTAIFSKPMHCITDVRVGNLTVKIDGANSAIVLNASRDIETVQPPSTCVNNSAVSTTDVEFAKLDTSGIAPVYSNDGKTITWTDIPAKLTSVGATAFGTGHRAGQALDPITITVGIG